MAAAIGVPVIKTGSRGYTSRYGSVDLLHLLGIPLAGSHERDRRAARSARDRLRRPVRLSGELGLLAKRVFPRDWRTIGAFVNRIGPFLAAVGADAQLTGVSDPGAAAALRGAADPPPRCGW